MSRRLSGQVGLETLAALSLAAMVALASAAIFAKGYAQAGEAYDEMRISRLLSSISSVAGGLCEGGSRLVCASVPGGITFAGSSRGGFGGELLTLTAHGKNHSVLLPDRVEFAAPNALYSYGDRTLFFERWGDTVIVRSVSDGGACG